MNILINNVIDFLFFYVFTGWPDIKALKGSIFALCFRPEMKYNF